MKLLLESWRRSLNEQKLPQIYCDMDGVLVDFEAGVVAQLNKDIQDIEAKIKGASKVRAALEALGRDYITMDDMRGKSKASKVVKDYMYARVGNHSEFWSDLPWMPGGKELWDFISPYKPHILTSPMQKGSEIGKAFWIDINLGSLSESQDVIMSHEKYQHALSEDGSRNILIDDWSKNTVPWDEAGGIAIQHKNGNTAATIATLKKLGFK